MRECFCGSDFKSSMRAAFTRGSPTWLRSFSRMARRFEIFDRSSASLLKGALRRRAWRTTLAARAAPYSPNGQNSCDCGSSSLCSSSLWRFPLVFPRAVCGRDRQLSRRVSRLAARNWRESGSRNESSGGTEAARSCFSSQCTPCDGVKLFLAISGFRLFPPTARRPRGITEIVTTISGMQRWRLERQGEKIKMDRKESAELPRLCAQAIASPKHQSEQRRRRSVSAAPVLMACGSSPASPLLLPMTAKCINLIDPGA